MTTTAASPQQQQEAAPAPVAASSPGPVTVDSGTPHQEVKEAHSALERKRENIDKLIAAVAEARKR